MNLIKKIKPGRIIVLGFLIVILLGTILLMLPISINEGENVLRFVAIDQAGNQGELEIKVKFLNN